MAERPSIPVRNSSKRLREEKGQEQLTFEGQQREIDSKVWRAQKRLKPQGSFSAEYVDPLLKHQIY
jgi:hypothetical protein